MGQNIGAETRPEVETL